MHVPARQILRFLDHPAHQSLEVGPAAIQPQGPVGEPVELQEHTDHAIELAGIHRELSHQLLAVTGIGIVVPKREGDAQDRRQRPAHLDGHSVLERASLIGGNGANRQFGLGHRQPHLDLFHLPFQDPDPLARGLESLLAQAHSFLRTDRLASGLLQLPEELGVLRGGLGRLILHRSRAYLGLLYLGLCDQRPRGGLVGLVLRRVHALGGLLGLILRGPHPEVGLLSLRLRGKHACGGLAGLVLCGLEALRELCALLLRGLCTDLGLFRLSLSGE